MFAWNSAEIPKSILQAPAECLKGLGEADHNRLPVGVGQGEVVEHVVERLAVNRNPQRVHGSEVGSPQVAWMVDLCEHHLPVRACRSLPIPNPTF